MNDKKTEFCLQGIACAPGVIIGKAFVFLKKNIEIPCYKTENKQAEISRFEKALTETREQILTLIEELKTRLKNDAETDIFNAHLLVLDDPVIIDETIKAINATSLNADHCFQSVAKKYIEIFSELDDSYFKERAADIKDVSQRILKNLLGENAQTNTERWAKKIIVAEELTPSETSNFDKANVLALLTDMGNRTSHAAIIARSLGIPAIVGLRNATLRISQNDDILVDGEKGLVYINPTQETLQCYQQISKHRSFIESIVDDEISKPDITEDDVLFSLAGNISCEDDIPALKKAHLTKIGLFRSEGIFMRENRIPSEEQQYQEYKKIIDAIGSKSEIVIRTLDIGGDKNIPGYMASNEENPFMGFRAIRLCLEYKDLFKDQLKAILRVAAKGNVKVMFPMISGMAELYAAKEILEESKNELRRRGEEFDEDISIGTMIEIPSAALITEELADEVDFFSIGTNDLTQYLLAVDRGNEKISHLYDPFHPAVLRAIEYIIKNAHKKGIPCSICGEMAGDPIFAAFFMGIEADTLSMTPISAPKIRYTLRHSKMPSLKNLAQDVLNEVNPRNIQERLNIYLKTIFTENI